MSTSSAAEAGATRVTYRQLLAQRPGNWFLVGNLTSGFGDSLVPLALAFAILDQTGSVAAFGLALACARLPQVVVTLIGGVVGDRLAPRTVALVTTSICAALNLGSGFVLLALHAGAAVVALVALQVVGASAGVFGGPAASKVLRQVYDDPAELDAATAFVGTTRSVSHIVAQGASGLLVFLGSPAICFFVNAATYAVFAVALMMVPDRSTPAGDVHRASFVGDLVAGFRAVGQRRQFAWTLVNFALCWLLVIQPFLVLTPAVLREDDPGSAALVYGLVGIAIGVGGILGGLLSGRVRIKDKLTWVVVIALADVPVFLILAIAPSSWLLFPLTLITGAQSTVARIWLNQELYRIFPEELISRVQSLLLSAWLVPALVSSVVVPAVAEVVGLDEMLVALSVVFVLVNGFMAVNVARLGRAETRTLAAA